MSMKFLMRFAVCLIALFSCMPAVHADPKYSEDMEKDLRGIADQFAKKYQMKVLGSGVGVLVSSFKVDFAISFMDNRALTIEQTRALGMAIFEEFWRKVYGNGVYHYYLSKLFAQYKGTNYDPHEKVEPQYLGVKIAFWDENVDRRLYPYISQLRIAEGQFYYYYARQDQSLQEPVIETLEQAAALLVHHVN